MERITHVVGTSLVTLIVLMSFAPISFAASEVQGTLRSDGSTGAPAQQGNAGGAPASTSLGGTVMGGTDSNESMSALAGFAEEKSMITFLSILLPLSLVLAVAGFLLYRKRAF